MDSFTIHLKSKDVYADIAIDAETRFDTSNYEVVRLLPIRKNKNVIGIMKDELNGIIRKEFRHFETKDV